MSLKAQHLKACVCSPLFAPYAPLIEEAALAVDANTSWLTTRAAGSIINARGMPLRFVEPDSGSLGYEERCLATGELETRPDNWHDFFNGLVWLTFPRSKALLNARHCAHLHERASDNGRSRTRDALTLFDESGVVVMSSSMALLDLIRGFRWRELFVERRSAVATEMRVCIFGHGLLDQAREPFIGLTGKALLIHTDSVPAAHWTTANLQALDERLAKLLADTFNHPEDLTPLPILGIPGWWPANADPAFYDNTRYFRTGRAQRG